MKLHTYQELITRIINLSTRDRKHINITFSGTDAYTNVNSANIPALPAGTILTQNQFSIWFGYALHEGPGHQSHTNLPLYFQAIETHQNPTFSYILNLLEDIRIENADIKLYPGDRKYLDSTHQFVDQKIPNHMAQNPDQLGLIYKHLFVHHRQFDSNIIQGQLDPPTAHLISEIDNCFSTQACINLADKLIQHLQTQPQPQPQTNQNNQTNQTNQNNQNNGDKNENEEEKSQTPNPTNQTSTSTPNNTSSDGLGNGSENENENNTNRNQKNSPHSYNSDSSAHQWQELTEIKNLAKSLTDLIENLDSKHLPQPDTNTFGKSIFPPVNILNDKIYVPAKENLNQYNSTRTQCTGQILALKKMFRIYLQAKTTKSTIRGLEEGKLDYHRLHIPATGSNLIFKDQHTKFLPETSVELMIDMSGSMNAYIARTAAIILAESLNSIPQIKLSISGFTTNFNNNNFDYRNQNPNIGRYNGMDILQFKDFTESYHKCRAKLGAIISSGSTPLGDAYGHALSHIISRSEPRRIIFLITDGEPLFHQGKNHSDYLLMEKIHLNCQRYNIQTLGLGIGQCKFLSNYFDQTINISDIQSLPKDLMQALKFFI